MKKWLLAALIMLVLAASGGANAINLLSDLTGFFLGGDHVKVQKDMFLHPSAIIALPCFDANGSLVIIDTIEPGKQEACRVPFGAMITTRIYGRVQGNYVRIYYPGTKKGFPDEVRGPELKQVNSTTDSLSPYYENFYPSNLLIRNGEVGQNKTGSTYTVGPNTISWWARGVKAIVSKSSGIGVWGHSKDNWEPVTFEFTAERLPEGISLTDPSEANIARIRAWMYGQEVAQPAGYTAPAAPAATVGLDPQRVDAQLAALWSKVNELTDGYNGIVDWIKAGENAPPSTVTIGGGTASPPASAGTGRSITGDYRLCVSNECKKFWIRVFDSAHPDGQMFGPFSGPTLPMKGAEIAVIRDGVRTDVKYKIQISKDGQNWSETIEYWPAKTPDVTLPL